MVSSYCTLANRPNFTLNIYRLLSLVLLSAQYKRSDAFNLGTMQAYYSYI